MLQWARERAHLAQADLTQRFGKLPAWEAGEVQPTFKQLESFAKATEVPFGYLFLPEPPEEPLPVPDFRTLANREPGTISPDLRDTLYIMQRRQAWLHDERREQGFEPLPFVGTARLADNPAATGREMRRMVGLNDGWAADVHTWQDAVGRLRQSIEDFGVMAVINGVVGNNTHRKLDVEEFRGFALSDDLAPLIFVNGADAKSAQMFTLAHELAHIWLGEMGEGLSGFDQLFPDGGEVETFCDRAAAEFLVPAREMQAAWPDVKREGSPFELLARRFKVSPIVIGRRAMDLRFVDRETFFEFYRDYIQREHKARQQTGGGDFFRNQNSRVGRLFTTEVVRAAREGRIGYKQAYELTGLRGSTFQEYTEFKRGT
jgi:Zn-dependent peptidase ImmA (M78 family)/transcriptional regulator with XRE-family HTH domain